MRTLTILLMSAAFATAQTNFGTITFTQKNGTVISNAIVTSVTANKLIWQSGLAGGVVSLADLPLDLQKRFHYDPVEAAHADVAEREQKAAIAKAQAEARQREAQQKEFQRRANEYFKNSTIISGTVFQKTATEITVAYGGQEYSYQHDPVAGTFTQTLPRAPIYVQLRDADLSSVKVDDEVCQRVYEPKIVRVIDNYGRELQRTSYTVRCAPEFANDPRAKD